MRCAALPALLCIALGGPALAAVGVSDPWVRPTTSFQKSTVAFMQLTSTGDARLVKAESPVATQVEIHQMVMKNYRMTMQSVQLIELPAGQAVALRPDGYMVMLSGLKQQIRQGDSIPISIIVEGRDRKRETIQITALAVDRQATGAGKAEHAHSHDTAHIAAQAVEASN